MEVSELLMVLTGVSNNGAHLWLAVGSRPPLTTWLSCKVIKFA